MVFNWFRRQVGKSAASSEEKEEKQEQQSATPPVESPQSESESATQEQSATVADDYLSWAKAAYTNLKKQESAPSEAETEAPEVQADTAESTQAELPESTEATETAPEPEIEEAGEAGEAEEAEEAEGEDIRVEASSTAPSPESPVVTEAETDTEQVEPEETEAPTASNTIAEAEPPTEQPEPVAAEESATVPIWARKSEREERLKRLEATAIETPEPESVAPPTTPPEAEADVALDEEFLWSAKVLADQGRTPEDVSAEEISWLKQLRSGLGKTRRGLVNQLKSIVGQGPLNQDAVMEIEALLLQADVGIEATDYIIETLQAKMRQEVLPPEQAIAYLKQILRDLLDKPCQESYGETFFPEKDILNIWLMTGVNGAGKTTTIGKLAHLANKSGYKCLIGAADTFRAAAVEQVKIWGERSRTEVIANPGKNTDPAAVVFDSITAAKSRNTELLLVDTAGRLQNKKNLMEELAKIRRIIDKKAPEAKVESLLVLDATLGQNGLRQAEVFSEAAQLSGVVLTKLDGTAKGGVALAIVQQLGLPIRFIGAGEGIEDLRPFSSYEFVEALLSG
ncbi:MAG: signal recognition particle-docking protein FtsY [Coleofasciculus sp. C1-SOL-03]|uniref:signal recognition particle-docking protein FtsY n=1 Tax=Coleofasciculus sp. C1-SOL-03 TaxID=3069522 RepID=UPI0032F67569